MALKSSCKKFGKLFVISSPSGGGKTTLVRLLLKRKPCLYRSISVTTRPPRNGEKKGKDYRFIRFKDFLGMRQAGGLLEWAKVHGFCYGTPRQPVEKALMQGKDVVLAIDVQGAAKIRKVFRHHAVLIFIMPPSFNDLKKRLLGRKTDASVQIKKRLEEAGREMYCASRYDYVVVNHTINDALYQLEAIITAEGLRVISGLDCKC
jgi:guanylate kinase